MEHRYRKIDLSPDSLLGCRFFDNLERADRAHVIRFCEGRRYAAKSEIITFGESNRDVFFILSGRVQASLLTADGKMVTFQDLGQGEMFGELAALDGAPRSSNVLAIEDTSLVRMSGPNFKDLVARIPSLAEQSMLRLCALSRFLCERLFAAMALNVPEQIRLEVCRIVRSHVSTDGTLTIEHAPTHEHIAQRVGTSREQVTRVMSELNKDGLIVQSRRNWHVPSVDAVCARFSPHR